MGGVLPETTIAVSRSNKSASASFGWLNHFCYDGAVYPLFRGTTAVYFDTTRNHTWPIFGNRNVSVRFHFNDTQVNVLKSVRQNILE